MTLRKLTDDDVRTIRHLIARGERDVVIGQRFPVSLFTIRGIRKGVLYGNVTDGPSMATMPQRPVVLSSCEARTLYQREKALAAERHAPEQAKLRAALEAAWQREMDADVKAGRGGRPKAKRDAEGRRFA